MSKKTSIFILFSIHFFALLNFNSIAQQQDIWKTLFTVKYGDWRSTFNPVFPAAVKVLENKQIIIKGFLIPLQEQKKHTNFLLSAFPFDQCFYCGKAGPETVIEVTVKNGIKATDKIIQLKGTLQLNSQDPTHLFYIIDDGELVE
jgi:hypothetical protein